MPQQYPFGSPNDRYRKKLFVDTGAGFMEVKAKIVEPYSPPSPQLQVAEIKIINAPSHFHQMGIASYKCSLTLLFKTKKDYVDYMTYCGWTHKFYDEKGSIYLGAAESINTTAYEASTKYLVEVSLLLIKKDSYDEKDRFEFVDLVNAEGKPHWAKRSIEDMANRGLVAVLEKDGQPVLYFRPDAYITRAEFIVFLNRTRRFIERAVRE